MIKTDKKLKTNRIFLFLILLILFSFSTKKANAMVSFDNSSESHADAIGSSGQASFSWTHTPATSAAGVVVYIFSASSPDYVTSVTYGGTGMTQVSSAADTNTEPGRVDAFFLGSSVPQGAQTVEVTRTNNSVKMYGVAITVRAMGSTTSIAGSAIENGDAAYVVNNLNDNSPPTASIRMVGAYYGGSAVLPASTAGGGSFVPGVNFGSIDWGLNVAQVAIENTPGQGSRPVGIYGASDDHAAVYLAITESASLGTGVYYDNSSESHVYAVGSTSQDSFTWTHTPASSPAGVLVFVYSNSSPDYVTSVTYGGTGMTQVSSAADTNTEPGRVDAFFLGSSVPQGAQSVVVTRTNNTTIMYAVAITVIAAGDTLTDGYVVRNNNAAYTEENINDASPGTDSLRFAAAYYGGTAIVAGTSGIGSVKIQTITPGAYTMNTAVESVGGQGSRPVGFTAATDDRAAVYLVIKRAPIIPPTVTTQAVTDVTYTSGSANGNITATGSQNATRRGFAYKLGTTGDPTTSDSVLYEDGDYGTGAYVLNLTSLLSGTGYRVRAYAVNSDGTGYGDTVQLNTTNYSPTVTLNTTIDGGSGTNPNPTFNFTGIDIESNPVEYNIQISSAYFGGEWSEQQPAGDVDKIWKSVSISGNKILAANGGGSGVRRLYYYDGSSWSELQPAGDVDKNWTTVSISGDKMVAAVYGERLYYYDGSSWSEQQPAGDVNKNWAGVSISGDKIVASVLGGRLYYYDGSSWSELQPAGDVDKNWSPVNINGDRILAANPGAGSGRLYYYDGSSWSEEQPAGDTDIRWRSVSISGDKMVASVNQGRLYYYDGSSWSELQPAGDVDKYWGGISISGDKIVVGVTGMVGSNTGRLYYYDGSSWSEQQPAGDVDKAWDTVSISGDKMVAAVNGGRLYISEYTVGDVILDQNSVSDTGFTSGHPFTSGSAVDFTVQSGSELDLGTYLWRVRAIDPSGSNTYGTWADYRTYTLTEAGNTISGYIYQPDGSSPYLCSSSGNVIVYLRVNTAGSYSGVCSANSGLWEVTGVQSLASGSSVYIYTSGITVRGSTVLISNGSGQTDVPIIQNRVVLRDDANGSITNTEIGAGDTGNKNDIIAVSGGALTVNSSYETHIYTGDTFAPGGNVSTGKLHVVGNYTGNTETLTLTGSGTTTSRPLYINGGTFTAPAITDFEGVSDSSIENTTYKELSFTPTISGSASYTFLGASSVNGDFTVDPTSTGTNPLTVNLGGTLMVSSSNTTTLTGTTSGISILDTVEGSNYTFSTGMLDIKAAGTFTARSSNIYLTGITGAIFAKTGVFTAGSSTAYFNQTSSDTTLTSGSVNFYNLNINMSGRTGTLGNAIIVDNNLTLTAGSFGSGNYPITVKGDWDSSGGGVLSPGTGTVYLTGLDQTISGNNNFYNLAVTGSTARAVTFAGNSVTSIASGGSLVFQGFVGQLLTLQSSDANDWHLHVDNGASTSVSYVSVTNSDASEYKQIDASNQTNVDGGSGGTNTNWAFYTASTHDLNFDGLNLDGLNIN